MLTWLKWHAGSIQDRYLRQLSTSVKSDLLSERHFGRGCAKSRRVNRERESNREDEEEKKQGEKQGRERNEVIKGQAGMASWQGTRLG